MKLKKGSKVWIEGKFIEGFFGVITVDLKVWEVGKGPTTVKINTTAKNLIVNNKGKIYTLK